MGLAAKGLAVGFGFVKATPILDIHRKNRSSLEGERGRKRGRKAHPLKVLGIGSPMSTLGLP